MREYTKVIPVSQFRTARIGDVFIMKDGRVVIFIGYNSIKQFHFLWVDNVIGNNPVWKNSNTVIDVKWYNTPLVWKRLDESIDYLVANVPIKYVVLSYENLPALIGGIGHSDNKSILVIANNLGLSSGQFVTKSNPLELQRGYVYKVQNKNYYELYLYLGYYKNLRVKSMYTAKGGKRKAHLWLYCGNEEDTSLNGVMSRLRMGYDGNFRLNIPKNKLSLVGQGKVVVDCLPKEEEPLYI